MLDKIKYRNEIENVIFNISQSDKMSNNEKLDCLLSVQQTIIGTMTHIVVSKWVNDAKN